MPSSSNPSAGKTARDAKPEDATRLLMTDHREVEQLFSQYEKLGDDGDPDEKMLIAAQICAALEVHTQIEEEIFYPAARGQIKQQDLLDEALVEHAAAKELVAEIKGMTSDEPLYDAKVQVLGEQVRHHVREEENELFPQVRKTSLDLQELGAQLAERKKARMAGTVPSATGEA